MQVPPARVVFSPEDRAEIAAAVTGGLSTGALTLGQYGKSFEAEFAAAHGVPHAVAVSSGTAALEIALRLLEVAGGDVVVPANTFFATAAAVLHAGARPVFADVDPDTFALTPESVEAVLTPTTRAVVVVHIAGLLSPRLPELADRCAELGVPLVEDAAHAHGCSLDGRAAGTFGLLGAFSFYPTKVITSGEGGMLVTSDAGLAEQARVYRDQGKAGFLVNAHTRLGYAWRMSELHAATGLVHLRRLPEFLERRAEVAAQFDAALAEAKVLRPLPPVPGAVNNYYKYIVLLPAGTDRAAVKARARERGVGFSGEVYDTPLHRQPVFSDIPHGPLPVSEDVCARHICLPVLSDMTQPEIDRVSDVVLAIDDQLAADTVMAS